MLYRFGELELDTSAFELRRAHRDDVIAVEPQVFDVLRMLVEHADGVVTKEELLDEVWGTRFVTESALTSRIKDARKAIGDDGRNQRLIRTLHGRGYRFVEMVVPEAEAPASAARYAAAGSDTPDTPQLLERARELAMLSSALDAARLQRAGSVVLVAGEAGVGKTALARQFTAHAHAHGVRVLAGGCDDMITPRTMGPLRDIAHEVGGPLEAAFGSGADVERVFTVLRDLLAEQPTVLLIEDVHWADDATLDVIRFVARRVADLPALLVATYREEHLAAAPWLRRVLGSLTGTQVRRLALSPLSREAVGTLAGDVPIAIDELYAVTRGNPFFVTEVLAAGELRVPTTVRDAVLGRVDALTPPARDLVEHAAVVPSRAERSLLAKFVPDLHVAMTEAELAGVLSGDEQHVWFHHELARHAVEASLTTAKRMRLNQQVLAVLAARDHVDAARLVHHAERAGDITALTEYLPLAASDAIRLGSYSQAITFLEMLLSRADGLTARSVAVAASQLSYAFYMVNRFADSARYGRRGVAAAEAAGEPAVLADSLLWLARTLYWSDGPCAAEAVVERAIPVVEGLGDTARIASAYAELARAQSDLATVGSVAEPTPSVVEHAERSLALAEQLGDSYLRCHALQYRGTGRIGLDDLGGVDDLAVAVALAHLDPRDEMPTRACVNAAGGCFRAGRLDDAERYAVLGLERARGGEFTAGAYRLELTLQSVRMDRGEWDEAEEALRTLVEWPGEPGIMRLLAASHLVRLLARRGRHETAANVLALAATEANDSSEIALIGPVTAAALEAAWLDGRVDAMPAIAARARALAVERAHRSTYSELARALQRAGHDVTDESAPQPVGPWAPALAGRWQDAADVWDARGCRYERAVELALAPDPSARDEGRVELDALGATATLAVIGNA